MAGSGWSGATASKSTCAQTQQSTSTTQPNNQPLTPQTTPFFISKSNDSACGLCLNQPATQTKCRTKNAAAHTIRWKKISKGSICLLLKLEKQNRGLPYRGRGVCREQPVLVSLEVDWTKKGFIGLWGLEICLRGRRESVQKLIVLQTFPPNPCFLVFFFCPPSLTTVL